MNWTLLKSACICVYLRLNLSVDLGFWGLCLSVYICGLISKPPHGEARLLQRRHIELALDVDEAAALDHLCKIVGDRPSDELAMGDRHHDGAGARQFVPCLELQAVLVARFAGVGHRI